jgi:hypothetical protein
VIGWLERLLTQRRQQTATEAAHEARLVKFETELEALRGRADTALDSLNARHDRNHWRESIEEMITGVLR